MARPFNIPGQYMKDDPVRMNASRKKWSDAHPDNGKNWYLKNREKVKRSVRVSALVRRYGITEEEYREKAARQQGTCAICGTDAKGNRRNLHVDHNHTTKKVRDLLCARCNTGVAVLERSAEWTEAATEYLRRHK